MNSKNLLNEDRISISRREVIGSGLGLAALGLSQAVSANTQNSTQLRSVPKAPFDSLRDYIAALDARGLVVRIPRVNQDEYEATALMYRIRDQHGMRGGPVLFFEEILIDGKWVKGPLIVNDSGHLYSECLLFGLEPVDDEPVRKESWASSRKARAPVEKMIAANGGWYPQITPIGVYAAPAP